MSDKEQIARWLPVRDYVCRTCGAVARVDPNDGHRWGCAKCGGASHSVYLNFRPIDEPDLGAWLSNEVEQNAQCYREEDGVVRDPEALVLLSNLETVRRRITKEKR